MLRQVTLFSETDIQNVFDVFDITGRGYLDDGQVLKGVYEVQ
jgi:hypothetical protein